MCDICTSKEAGWRGWQELPPPRQCKPVGEWIDLSHCLTEDLSRIPSLPAPTFRRISQLSENSPNVTEIKMVTHFGTHLDAPCHFIQGAPSAEQIPLDRLHGPGVVWRIDVAPLSEITVEQLEQARPIMQRGDIVLISTNWARHIGTSLYEDQPHLSLAAAQWLVDHGAKIVAVDFSTPDLTAYKRPPGFRWPVHKIMLSNGVLIAEHLTNLAPLEGRTVEAMFMGLNIRGSDGLPARVLARAAV